MRLIAFLMTLIFTVSCAGIKPSLKIPNDIGYLYQSVGLVQIVNGNDVLVSGTAFAYDTDHLLTAAHVCLAALEVQIFVTRKPSIDIVYSDNKGVMRRVADLDVVSIDPTDDICMLHSKDHGMAPVVIADPNTLKVRDEVVIIGAPMGVAIGEFPGRVMDLSSKIQNPMLNGRLIVSSAATGGVSGSPVFDKFGRVVGILVAGPQSFDHLSICVGIKQVHQFLKDGGFKQ